MEQSQSTAKATIMVAVALAVSAYFEQKDAKNEVFSTADGFLFENLGFAKNHATTLEDKNVTPHTNANNLEVVGEEEVTRTGYQLTDADKQLLATGLSNENYNPLKSLIKTLKIETADQKAETLIKALEDYKTNNPIE
jgi:hypothetical protein